MQRDGNFLCAGDASAIEPLLRMIERDGMTTRGNPDVYVRAYGSFGVDDARELSARAAGKALGNASRVFVIAADAYTVEAQNALLKTLEEPAGSARFFLIAPAPMQLLPTLRSRMQILELEGAAAEMPAGISAAAFLAAAPAKRLDLLKPLLEKNDDDRRDMGAALAFLAGLERSLAKKAPKSSDAREGIEAVYRARRFIGDRGALWKPLLEQVALLTPVI